MLNADNEHPVLGARLTRLDDVDVIGAAEDVPDISDDPATPQTPVCVGRPEQQFTMLTVRSEMTAGSRGEPNDLMRWTDSGNSGRGEPNNTWPKSRIRPSFFVTGVGPTGPATALLENMEPDDSSR